MTVLQVFLIGWLFAKFDVQTTALHCILKECLLSTVHYKIYTVHTVVFLHCEITMFHCILLYQ